MKNYKIEGDKIKGFEPYFEKMVRIATIDHEKKEIRPSHGYFAPHPHSKYSKKIAKKLGYTFNNN